jgi:hypothetical protein
MAAYTIIISMKMSSKQTAKILLTASLVSVFWLGYELEERGINADETGTAGYTTNFEMFAILTSVVVMALSILILISKKSKKVS